MTARFPAGAIAQTVHEQTHHPFRIGWFVAVGRYTQHRNGVKEFGCLSRLQPPPHPAGDTPDGFADGCPRATKIDAYETVALDAELLALVEPDAGIESVKASFVRSKGRTAF
ncbi:hypothetical protein [Rhizobium sp. CIAT894]|uniref:hypothetical protein n=1 Tax=Rhizobium sp. CIAT894 TaxID=2020312 RepID=UPI000F736D6C|nr:hypothetical protein [Rhizobium sp. CIAT894]